jgi:hypothetical protein
MVVLLHTMGLRYNENALVTGAQTMPRREARGPVRDLLGGETSPAGFFF